MKKKILITVFSIIGLIVLAIGGYAIYLYSAVKDTASKMHEQVSFFKRYFCFIALKGSGPFNSLKRERGQTPFVLYCIKMVIRLLF
jgi:anionic cell wall polymer biosynthesis LytR-Cps2A-Psr (LCP) family protein